MWDFKAVDDLNSVPEQFRGLYNTEKGTDGKFTVSAAVKPLVDAYVGETTQLTKTRKDLAAANKESAGRRVTQQAVLDLAAKLGIDNVDQENPIASLETHFEGIVAKATKGGGDLKISLEKIKQDYEKRNNEITATSAAREAKMLATLQKHLIGEAAVAAIAANNGDPMLRTFVEKNVKVVQEGEDYVVRVVDDAGEVRSNGAGGWMGVADRVVEMKGDKQYARLFNSEAAGGTGHTGSKKPASATNNTGEKSAVDKITSGLAKGLHDKAGAGARA